MPSFELVAFDLDFTLWDCGGTYCDCLTPPFSKRNGRVVDRDKRHVRLFPDVLEILDECEQRGLPMALASRTHEPEWAEELIGLLGIADRFAYSEIYPTAKTKHFAALHRDSGIEYEAMLFFDDEQRNIVDVSALGVTAVLVNNGVDRILFEEAIART